MNQYWLKPQVEIIEPAEGTELATDRAVVRAAITIRNGFTAEDGGGIHCANGASPTVDSCILENNNASGEGGAIFADGSGPQILGCVLRGNSASRGGAILARNAFPLLEGSTITGNSPGGAVVCETSAISIVSSTIAGNRSTTFGGGLRVIGAPGSPSWVTLDRSIVWQNCANAGAQVFLDDPYSGITVICSAIDASGIGGLGTVDFIGEQVEEDPLVEHAPQQNVSGAAETFIMMVLIATFIAAISMITWLMSIA